VRIIVQNEPQHTHAEEDTLIEKSERKSKLVETVKQDPSVPIKRIYNTVVRRHQQGGGDVTSIQRFSNIRSAMTRARQEFFPNIPHSIDDVVIADTWGENGHSAAMEVKVYIYGK
jgi:hypothetical protein